MYKVNIMVDYIVEFYEKGARKPYERQLMSLPYGSHPTFTNSKECFNFKLAFVPKAKVRYASNGSVAAEKYIDANGNGRLRWKRRDC